MAAEFDRQSSVVSFGLEAADVVVDGGVGDQFDDRALEAYPGQGDNGGNVGVLGYRRAASSAGPVKTTVRWCKESRSKSASAGVPFQASGGLVEI